MDHPFPACGLMWAFWTNARDDLGSKYLLSEAFNNVGERYFSCRLTRMPLPDKSAGAAVFGDSDDYARASILACSFVQLLSLFAVCSYAAPSKKHRFDSKDGACYSVPASSPSSSVATPAEVARARQQAQDDAEAAAMSAEMREMQVVLDSFRLHNTHPDNVRAASIVRANVRYKQSRSMSASVRIHC